MRLRILINAQARDLKILVFFVHKYKWGEKVRGDERRFLELAKEYKKEGIKLYVIEHAPSMQQAYYGKQVYSSLEIPSQYESSHFGTLKQMLYTLLFTIRTCYKLKNKIDVIYAHNQDLSNIVLAYIAKLITKKPLVIVLHSLQDFRFPFNKLIRMYNASFIDYLLILIYRIIGKFILSSTDLIFTISNVVMNDAIKLLKSKRIVVTGNGVDPTKFRHLRLKKEYDAVFLGRIDFAQKGIDTLLKVWKVIINLLPSAKLLILGGFQDDYNKKLLMGLIEILGLRNNVEVKGFVTDDQLIELLNKSKIFIFPSRFEGFGLSVLEAMSCGLPCIISDIPALKEVYNGIAIFSSPDNVIEFASKSLKILTDQAEYEKISYSSKIHALRFSWSDVARREIKELILLLTRKQRSKDRYYYEDLKLF